MGSKDYIERIIYISIIMQDKKIQHDIRIGLGIEADKIYNKLNLQDRNLTLENIYIIYRQLGSLYFESNQYTKSEFFFEKSLNIKSKKDNIDILINECYTKEMLAREKIMIYLNTNNESKLQDAKELISFLSENYDDKWGEKFKNKIYETRTIYESVLKNDLKTIITMIIPYHLLIDDAEEIKFKYNGIECAIKSKTIRSQDSSFIIGDNIYTEKDKYGIINHSIITLTIGKYINGNELVKVNKAIDTVYKPLSEAINVYNYFLKSYIISTGKYWISEINENMIFRFETLVLAGDVKIKNIPLSISMKVSSSGKEKLSLSEEQIENIKKELENENTEIWKLSLNYAKDYYLIKDYKNAVIMINIALENFTYYFAKEKLKQYIAENEIEDFLNGKVSYENYFLKEYITKESFELAKNDKIIKDSPPTIYKIYSECHKYEKLRITKTQLSKKLSIIKDQRNEIVHGKNITKDLRYVAEKAIDEFEDLVGILIG